MVEQTGPAALRALARRLAADAPGTFPIEGTFDDEVKPLYDLADVWERQMLKQQDVSLISWDRLRALLAVEHTHGDGMNECRICDEPLTDAAADEIERLRAQLSALETVIRVHAEQLLAAIGGKRD